MAFKRVIEWFKTIETLSATHSDHKSSHLRRRDLVLGKKKDVRRLQVIRIFRLPFYAAALCDLARAFDDPDPIWAPDGAYLPLKHILLGKPYADPLALALNAIQEAPTAWIPSRVHSDWKSLLCFHDDRSLACLLARTR